MCAYSECINKPEMMMMLRLTAGSDLAVCMYTKVTTKILLEQDGGLRSHVHGS